MGVSPQQPGPPLDSLVEKRQNDSLFPLPSRGREWTPGKGKGGDRKGKGNKGKGQKGKKVKARRVRPSSPRG